MLQFDEYEGNDVEMMRRNAFDDVDGGIEGGRRFIGSMMMERSGVGREYETGSSRHPVIDRRKSSYFERTGGLNRGDRADKDGSGTHPRPMSFYRDNYDSDEPIKVQGKMGF